MGCMPRSKMEKGEAVVASFHTVICYVVIGKL